MFVSLFRINGQNHAQVSVRPRIPRNGQHRVLCAVVIDDSAQRLAPHSVPGRSAPITCDGCLASFTAFVDFADAPSDPDFVRTVGGIVV